MGVIYSTATKAIVSAQILGGFAIQNDVENEEYVSAQDVKVIPTWEQKTNISCVSMPCTVVGQDTQEFYKNLFFIADLGNTSLHLNRNLPVSIAHSDGIVTAYSFDIDEFGSGSNENEAIGELKKSIVELYNLYNGEQENLGPLPRQQWSFLKSVVTES